MKKRFGVGLISLLALATLVGCNGGNSSTAPNTSNTPNSSYSSNTADVSNSGSSNPTTSSSAGYVAKSVTINNKKDFDRVVVKTTAVKLEINLDPVANVNELISSGAITVTSSNTQVATVMGLMVSPVGIGTSTITVAAGGKSDTVTIKVVDDITLVPDDNYANVGGTISFNIYASGVLAKASDYDWTSSDTAIATIAADGKVTAVAAGKAKIKATAKASSLTYAEYEVEIGTEDLVYQDVSSVTEDKKAVLLKGTVVATSTKGYVLDDGTGIIYVYLAAEPAFTKGTFVKVSGTTSVFNGEMEIGKTAVTHEIQKPTTATTTTIAPLTSAIVDSLPEAGTGVNTTFTYYSYKAFASQSGNFDILNFIGSDVNIEPAGYTGKLETGKYYDIKGYIFGYNSKYNYADLIIDEATEITNETALGLSTYYQSATLGATSNIKLSAFVANRPADGKITWSVEGTSVTMTKDEKDDTKVTLTPSATVAGKSIVTATLGDKTVSCTINVKRPMTPVKTTVADLLALTEADSSKVYEVSGVLEGKSDTDAFGNGYLTDGTNTIKIYGSTTTTTSITDTGTDTASYAFSNPKDAKTTLADYHNGDKVTIVATFAIYKETYEIMGYFTSHTANTDTYTASINTPENGTATLSKTTGIAYGESVTVTPTASEGYVVDSVVVDHGFKKETLTAGTDGTYSFTATVNNSVIVTFKADAPVTAYTITPSAAGFGSTNYPNDNAEHAYSADGLALGFVEVGNYGSGFQLRYKNKYQSRIYNTAATARAISSIVITFNSAQKNTPTGLQVQTGTAKLDAALTSTAVTVSGTSNFAYTFTPTSTTDTYFSICHATSGGTLYIDSIVVNLVALTTNA